MVIDAELFIPKSRPRAFIIAVKEGVTLDGLIQAVPSEPFNPRGLVRTAFTVGDDEWVWRSLPVPSGRTALFSDLCERDEP